MKEYFEAHITMTGPKAIIQSIVESLRWKFSCIDGDPVLGEGIKCYATRFYNKRLGRKRSVDNLTTVADIIAKQGIVILRRKIELVIYDDRSAPCTGACVECVDTPSLS